MKKIVIPILCVGLMLSTSSCELAQWAVFSSPNSSNTEKGAVVGASAGAQTGAFIGSVTSDWHNHGQNTLLGAVIGTAAGAAIGAAVGSSMDKANKGGVVSTSPECQDYSYYNDNSNSGSVVTRVYTPAGQAVYFGAKKTGLSRDAKRRLDQVAAQLRNDPSASVEIYGHADNSGSYNDRLRVSTERATQVGNYLRSHGVPLSQIYCQGCADRYPVADNASCEGRARNRRVEIVVTHHSATADGPASPWSSGGDGVPSIHYGAGENSY